MHKSALPAPITERRPAHRELVDLDAMFPPLAVTDRDGAMADLGLRVKDAYPGAVTTAAGVRAIREGWKHRRRTIRQFLGNLAVILNSAFAVWVVGMVALLSTGVLR